MRHFLPLALPIRLLTTRMKAPATRCLLVPTTGLTQAPATGPLPTRIATVTVPTITPRAQVHRLPALVAHETAAIGAAALHSRLQRPGQSHPSSGILDSLGRNPQASRRGAVCLRSDAPAGLPHSSSTRRHGRARARDDDGDRLDHKPRLDRRDPAFPRSRPQLAKVEDHPTGFGAPGVSLVGLTDLEGDGLLEVLIAKRGNHWATDELLGLSGGKMERVAGVLWGW